MALASSTGQSFSTSFSDAPAAPAAAARPRWHLALEAWALATLVAAAAQVLWHLGTYQWDLIVYWWGGRAFLAGHSPYGPIPNQPSYLHYVYPPITAALFSPFALLSPSAAKLVWIALKAIALFVTVRLWQRITEVRRAPVPPLFFFTFAFGSALLVDFTAGNVAVFEQFGLWLAFAALLARRRWLFVLLVVAVAQLKLTPIFFLGLLLLIDERPRWGAFAAGVAAFAATLAANLVLLPAQSREFLTGVSSLGERGWGDPATLGVMQDLIDQVRSLGIGLPTATAYLLYFGAVAAVGLYTVRWWMRRRAAGDLDPVVVILVALAVYALVMPRMKDYSYVALLPVAWYVLARRPLQSAAIVAVAALIPRPLPQLNLRLPLLTQAYVYAPLLGALAVWIELISERDFANTNPALPRGV